MTTETNKDDNKLSESGDKATPEIAPECAPGCACEEPSGKGTSKIKVAVCLVVVVAIAGIILFKTTSAKQNTAAMAKNGFPSSLWAKSKGPVLNSAGQQGGSGAPLATIADLNTVAEKLNTVFLVIPSKDNAPTSKETGVVLASVERTLNEKGLSTGIYTLKANSPDYPDVAAKVTPPGIAVLTKGRSIGFVSGDMSETKLMQAYVASTSGGGCGPSGCPPPGGGKTAVPCN
jgi:hypothetical protein